MATIIDLQSRRKARQAQTRASAKAAASTLCRNGHHKWEVDKESVFDVDKGKLVTRYLCARCGKHKVKAH